MALRIAPMRIVSIAWPLVLLVLMLGSVPTLDHFLNSPDMGYQLSLGRLAILGHFPFVGMLQHYGPLVTLTSAAGQCVHHSALPEAIICALGYFSALVCVYDIVASSAASRGGWAVVAGVAASLAAWCLLARFYKWYYWCFPLLTVACLARFEVDRGKWWLRQLIVGAIAGIAFLYRHDLGAACLVTAGATIVVEVRGTRDICTMIHALACLTAGFLLPLGCWLLLLASVGGPSSCWRFFSALLAGQSASTQYWRLPLPMWDWRAPGSNESCRFELLGIAAITYAIAIVLGTRGLRRSGDQRPRDAVALFAAGILGFIISPQALFRPDVQHILQVIPPLVVVAALLLARLLSGEHSHRIGGLLMAIAYCALLAFPLVCLRKDLRVDLAPFGDKVVARYKSLAGGLDAADPANRVAQIARTIQARTSPDQPILVTPLLPQIYYWCDRPMSGLLNGYAGLFAKDSWRRINLAAVQSNPPALVVADRAFLSGNPDALFRKFNPELHTWLRDRYPTVVAEAGDLVVCAPAAVGDLPRPPSER